MIVSTLQNTNTMQDWENNEEINIFRDYLRIPTVHPNIDYTTCIEFLKHQATNLGLPAKVYWPNPNKPILIISWCGSEPQLKSIILNSHMDVVPVFEEKWVHKPFSADIDDEGRIYARGAQDMKSVGMQYLGAIRAIKKEGVILRRTVHVCFVPDEEIGGILGMKTFVNTTEFEALNVGFALDEGIASPTEEFPVFYGERSIWYLHLHCSGATGHGSLLLKNTAGEKVRLLLDKFMSFRADEAKKLREDADKTIGDVTTVNVTKLYGGVQNNVVPPVLSIGMDIRIAVDVDHTNFENMIRGWCAEAGGGIELEYQRKANRIPASDISDANLFWVAFKKATEKLNLSLRPQIFTGGTDSRYLREVAIPAIGFSPMNNTPVLLHDNDEYLKAETYLRGIDYYKTIISEVANS